MPTKYVQVGEHAIHYLYAGATTLPDVIPDFSHGRKLLLIHAAGSNGHAWHYQIDHLGQQHSPIAPDLPAHGRSSGVEGSKSIGEYAEFLCAVADALKLDAAVIIGRSIGGAIAMDFALRYPERVEALVLITTAAKFNLSTDQLSALRAVAMGRAPQAFTADGYSPKTVAAKFQVVREGWGEQIKTDPRVRYSDIMACVGVDLRDAISSIRKPTLILAGADDPVTPPSDAHEIHRRIGGSELIVIPDAAHHLPTERPEQVNEAIESFLSRLGGGAR